MMKQHRVRFLLLLLARMNPPKFKFIKSITIGSTVFDVIWDKKQGGGELSYPYGNERGYIKIGTYYLKTSPTEVLDSIIHELKECIQIEQSTRLKPNHDATSFIFHYTHREHDDLCARLAGLLTQFLLFEKPARKRK